MAEKHESTETIKFSMQKFNEKNGEIATLNSQVNTLTSTVNTLTSQVATDNTDFGNIYEAIVIKGAAEYCDANIHSTYASAILSIDTYSGDVDALKGYLSNIYTVISANTVGVTCTSGVYSDYDDAIQNIYNAYDNTITGLQGQISTLNGQINELQGYLSDIYDAIVDKGGTCTQNDYSSYDDGILSIPSATPSGGASLDDLKSQLNGIDVPSTNLVITNGNSLFKNMILYEKLYGGKYDLTDCTDVTDMFKNCTSLVEFELSNFGNNVNNDLILDISDSNNKINFAGWYQDIPAYNGQYIRKIIVNQLTYDYNTDEIAALRNKNIIVEVKAT